MMTLLGPQDAAELLLSTLGGDEIERYDRTLWTAWVESWLASADETWPLNVAEVLDCVESTIRQRAASIQAPIHAQPSAEYP